MTAISTCQMEEPIHGVVLHLKAASVCRGLGKRRGMEENEGGSKPGRALRRLGKWLTLLGLRDSLLCSGLTLAMEPKMAFDFWSS